MSDAIIRHAGQSTRITVIPSVQSPIEAGLQAIAIEMQRLMRKATTGPLTRDDAQNLALYIKALKEIREIQKDLAKDTDIDRMTIDELREIAQNIITKLAEKEKSNGS